MLYDVLSPTGATMQIRTRGHQVEYLRATYDPEKKRSFQKLIKPEDFTPEEGAGRCVHREESGSGCDRAADPCSTQSRPLHRDDRGRDRGRRTARKRAGAVGIDQKNAESTAKSGHSQAIPVPKPAKKAVKRPRDAGRAAIPQRKNLEFWPRFGCQNCWF